MWRRMKPWRTPIRYKLGLNRHQGSCNRSKCGRALPVMLDGITTYSCSTLTQSVRNRKSPPIEGIAGPNAGLHKVQQANDRRTGPPVRLLHLGPSGLGGGAAQSQSQTDTGEARHGMSGIFASAAPMITISKPSMRRGGGL